MRVHHRQRESILMPTSLRAERARQHLYEASLPSTCLDHELPWTTGSSGRTYSAVAFDQNSNTFVTTSIYDAPFELFDDEGQPVWRPDGMCLSADLKEERRPDH